MAVWKRGPIDRHMLRVHHGSAPPPGPGYTVLAINLVQASKSSFIIVCILLDHDCSGKFGISPCSNSSGQQISMQRYNDLFQTQFFYRFIFCCYKTFDKFHTQECNCFKHPIHYSPSRRTTRSPPMRVWASPLAQVLQDGLGLIHKGKVHQIHVLIVFAVKYLIAASF